MKGRYRRSATVMFIDESYPIYQMSVKQDNTWLHPQSKLVRKEKEWKHLSLKLPYKLMLEVLDVKV